MDVIFNGHNALTGWRRGVAVGCRTRDQEVAGSSLGRALRRKNSGQVSHTFVPLLPSSVISYRRKLGSKQACRTIAPYPWPCSASLRAIETEISAALWAHVAREELFLLFYFFNALTSISAGALSQNTTCEHHSSLQTPRLICASTTGVRCEWEWEFPMEWHSHGNPTGMEEALFWASNGTRSPEWEWHVRRLTSHIFASHRDEQ